MSSRVPRLGLVITATVALLLPACSESPREHSATTLHLIGEALPPFQALPELTRDFTRKTGTRIEIHPFEFETALAKTQLDFTGNTGNYDVVMGIYFNLGKYVENHEILPIQPFLDDPKTRDLTVQLENFFPPVMDVSTRYHGALYGLPATAQTMFLWYRKDLFTHPDERADFQRRYGYPLPVPQDEDAISWRNFRDLAEFFTRPKGQRLAGELLASDFFGTCLQAKRHPALWYEFSNYLTSFGASVVDDHGRVVVNSDAAREALDFYISLKSFSPRGTLQYTWDDALTAFQQGHVAMTTMWFDATPSLDDPANSRVVGKVGYSQIPVNERVGKRVAQYGGWAFYINADSRHPKEAFRLIQWLNRPDVQLRWAKMGGLPSTVSTFENPEYLAIPYHRAEREALQHAVAWPREPYSEEINSKAIDRIARAVSGEVAPQAALDALAEDVGRIIGRQR
jgi:multiple sugar transport system substrate-binding protein